MINFSDYNNFAQNAFKNLVSAFDVSNAASTTSQEFVNSTKKNLELVAKIVEITAKNLQEITARGAESVKQGLEHLGHSAEHMTNTNVYEGAQNQQKAGQDALQQSVQNAKEIAEITAKTHMDVMQLITQHFQANQSQASGFCSTQDTGRKK